MSEVQKIRLLQITDLHFGKTPQCLVNHVNPVMTFNAILDDIDRLRLHKDIIILSGDLSGIESYKSYKILNKILKYRDKKIIWLPGNHDNITDMIKYLKDFPRIISMALQNWSVITLDTSQRNSPVGYIHADELQMLERQLVKMKDKFIIIAMHHCPALVGSRWLDKHRVKNHSDFFRILSNHKNIRGIFTGHVHQKFEGICKDIAVYTTPSSCFQFEPNSQKYEISETLPGYRWLHLFDDGTLETGVNYVSAKLTG